MHFYNDWALRILKGQWTDYHAFYGLPLYAYLLAGLYKLFGYTPFVPGLIQGCLDAGTAVLLYKLAVTIFEPENSEKIDQSIRPERSLYRYRGEIIGILAAIGWAFFQPAQAYSIILMPTSWLVFVFWFVVWQIVKRDRSPGHLGLLLLGALIGFTSMGIATVLFLIPLLLGAVYLKWKPDSQTKGFHRTIGVLVVFLGISLGTSPAWVHNYFVAHDPVVLSAHSGVNFWIGNNPLANGYPKFPPGLHAGQEAMLQDSITTAEKVAGRPLKRSEVSAFWSLKASDWIGRHPAAWLKLLVIKIKNVWNAFQYDDLSVITALRDQLIIFSGISFGVVAALGLPGLVIACWKFSGARWIAVAVLLQVASLLTVFVTERYRLAIVPGLLLFAAFGLCELWRNIAIGRPGAVVLFLTLLFSATVFVSLPKEDPALWALDSYNSGLQALAAGNLTLAQKKLDRAYAYSPLNAEINFAEGNLRLAQGHRTAAKAFYLATLKLDPRHEGSYNNLGVLAVEENRWELAAKFFLRALEEDPRDPKTYYLLARTCFQAGDFLTARSWIAQAIKLKTQPEFLALKQEIENKVHAVTLKN